ncbi:acetolactate decarboxylase [Streptosporangium sp. NPDC002721]|uniref:acetolactate decarboxylase n=1 Tax=Streptosporangium sp. NPDC002721 TaxID=3366188 RepID=UPI0036A53CFB
MNGHHDLLGGLLRAFLAHRDVGGALHRDTARAREIFQSSTMDALLDGVYEGDLTIGELRRHGDFGLGTFNGLDGELVGFDGRFHHLRPDGTAVPADPAEKTPFAAVTFFRADREAEVGPGMSRAELESLCDGLAAGRNLFYAVRLDGLFARVTTRTVARQHRPYPPLVEATRDQRLTTFTDVEGTVAGFRTPDYAQGIAVAGYHLHFLDAGRTGGGHVIDVTVRRATLRISTEAELRLSLPRTPQFMNADLTGHDVDAETRRAEGGGPGGG